MADRKITQLTAMTAGGQATGDLLTIVDVSEAAAVDKNKKITVESLFKGIPGNVGIGETAPLGKVHIKSADSGGSVGSSADELVIENSDYAGITLLANTQGLINFSDSADVNVGSITYDHGSNFLGFRVNDSERFRVDSSGRLLVGTSTGGDINYGGSTGGFHLVQGNADAHLMIRRAGGNGSLTFVRSNSSVDSPTIVSNNDIVGQIRFVPYDGGDYLNQCARISAEIDGTPGANDMPGRLVFSTTADGASSPTERMRITEAGHALVGTTTTNPGDGNTTAGISFRSNGKYFLSCTNDGGHINRNDNGAVIHCRRSGNLVGSITVDASNTAFNTSSDYRLKENVVDLDGSITRVKQLAPKRFNFIIDANKTVDGFLAHEAQTVVPEAVTGTYDEVDDDGNAVMQCIDHSKLVPLLTAALQEAIAKIETLETKVAALEAG